MLVTSVHFIHAVAGGYLLMQQMYQLRKKKLGPFKKAAKKPKPKTKWTQLTRLQWLNYSLILSCFGIVEIQCFLCSVLCTNCLSYYTCRHHVCFWFIPLDSSLNIQMYNSRFTRIFKVCAQVQNGDDLLGAILFGQGSHGFVCSLFSPCSAFQQIHFVIFFIFPKLSVYVCKVSSSIK